ncbi:transcriptional regulator with XRE-family HTH domain [Kitasatospora sp. MAP12-15]|uniref:helix-turn-helix domain-containing protein n=1 Tax=unclassified Kitasatospora TaxID=2633591 RepID=UPI002475CE64|nr:helix-turn-helix transcriptional regulator [Kitasatospora sp. MAP12-44]MDH6115653.1 transcriptional regulator with XRE-family HTH domain [Kitasatospora sp. MAP12-44]
MAVSTVRRRRLGDELRKLREGKKMTAEQVADVMGWSQPKINRIENAKTAAKLEDVVRLLDFYEVADGEIRTGLLAITKDGSKRGWWLSYRDAINATAFDLITLETEASTFKTYEPSYIPGLFQTPDYARIVIERLGGRMGGTVEDQVQVRMARQSILTRPNPVEVWAVIHEAALCSNGKRPDIMGPQLDKVLALNRLDNVNIQVMPINAAIHPGMGGPMAIIGFPQRSDLDVVLVEGLMSSLFVEDPADVEQYRARFTVITAEALNKDDSLAFILEQKAKIT